MIAVPRAAWWVMPVKASEAYDIDGLRFAVPDGLLSGRRGADLDLMHVQRVHCRPRIGSLVEVRFDENGRWRPFPMRNMFHLITSDVHGEGVDFFVECLLNSGQAYGGDEAGKVREYMRFMVSVAGLA